MTLPWLASIRPAPSASVRGPFGPVTGTPARPRVRAARRPLWHAAGAAIAALLLALPVGSAARGWRVDQHDGVHWLVTPGGQRFFSLGVNVVNGGEDDPKAHAGQGYLWSRHYRDKREWGARTQQRLQSWGFNTAGGWSEPSSVMTLPLIPEIDLGRHAAVLWFDLFDASMQEITDQTAQRIVERYRDNPRVIGYFTDNEVGWWSSPLFLWYLQAGWDSTSKQVLWHLLNRHYDGQWERLVADFVPVSPQLDSFEKLKAAGAVLKLRPGGQGIRVVGEFTRLVAQRYYQLMHHALRKADPTALIVGDRLPLYYNQDAVKAIRGLVDVLSTNYNVDVPDGWVAPYYFEGLQSLAGKPVLVSETFFAAAENRSGNRNNGHLMNVKTQAQRVRGAMAAMRHFASFPNIVGVHWFQYYDQPTGGRSDGEDFNMGLVDIRDRPYEGLVAGFAALNPRLPAMRTKARWQPATAGSAEGARVVRAATALRADDKSLLDWTDKAGTRMRGLEVPEPYAPFGDIHLAWSPRGLHFFHIGQNYVDLDLLHHEGEFPLSETYRIVVHVDAGAGRRSFAMHLAPRRNATGDRYVLAPQLWRHEGGRPVERLDPRGRLQVLDTLLPHVQVEGLIPPSLLGVPALRPGSTIDLSFEVTSFYRELTMRLGPGRMVLDAATRSPRR